MLEIHYCNRALCKGYYFTGWKSFLKFEICFWRMSSSSLLYSSRRPLSYDNTSLHWHYLLIIFASTNFEPEEMDVLALSSCETALSPQISPQMSSEGKQTLTKGGAEAKVIFWKHFWRHCDHTVWSSIITWSAFHVTYPNHISFQRTSEWVAYSFCLEYTIQAFNKH